MYQIPIIMKIKKFLFLPVGLLLFLVLALKPDIQPVPGFPADIDKLLISSCYECHSTDSRNTNAKEALNFQQWNDYKVSKQIGLLDEICELVGDNKMPPEKYLSFNPDKKLSEEQIKKICDWTEKESGKLMGE